MTSCSTWCASTIPRRSSCDVQMTATEIAFDADVGIGGSGVDNRRSRVALSSDDGQVSTEEADRLTEQLAAAGIDVSLLCLDSEVSDTPEPESEYEVGDTLDVIALPGPDGSFPPDTEVECNGTGFDLGDLSSTRSLDEIDPDLLGVLDGWLTSGEGEFWVQEGWRLLFENQNEAQFVNASDAGVSFVGAELGPNGWIWAGASSGESCDVTRVLPEGLSAVEWEIDPSTGRPGADATEVEFLATENSCASGQAMGERLLGPDVVETDDQVLVVVAAIALPGTQECPGNPSTPVTIELAAPLGDREIVDGSRVGPLAELLAD